MKPEENLCNLEVNRVISDTTIDKLHFIKIQCFCFAKTLLRE